MKQDGQQVGLPVSHNASFGRCHSYRWFAANITRGAYSVTISGSLFNNSLFSILECVRDIPEVRDALYSLSSIDLSTEPGTCVQS